MAKIQFYPIDLAYKVIGGKASVYIYGRTPEGKQICVVDEEFEPYFYLILDETADVATLKEQLKGITAEKNGETYNVVKVTTEKKTLKAEERTGLKVVVNLPKGVPVIKDKIRELSARAAGDAGDASEVGDDTDDDNEVSESNEKTSSQETLKGIYKPIEFDILYTRRYLIDKKLIPLVLTDVDAEALSDRTEKTRVPIFRAKNIEQVSDESLSDLRILAFDIETYNPLGKITDPERHPIVMISLYGSDGFEKVLTSKRFKSEHDYIEFLEGEAEMLERFRELVAEYAPDVLTGYYSDGYDFPYIIKRAEKYKIKLDISLDYERPNMPRGRAKSVDTTGIVHFDVLNFIRRIMSRKMKTDSFTLDNVAGELLGAKKDDVEIDKLAQYWDETSDMLDVFAKYNLQDSRLTYDLCEKVLPNLIELVKLVGQPIKDINRMSFSQLVEWYLMRRAREFNHFIPNRPGNKALTSRMGVQVKGAFVFQPKPGLYEDVVVFDFRSLYPSIIVSHNISIETLNCDCCRDSDKGSRVPLEDHDLWFCKKKEGFFATVLEDVITRRMRVKEIMKKADPQKRVFLDARQESLKVLSNSFYGYLGFFGARWYTKDSARSVTAYGRHYIHKVIDTATDKGFEVLYSDTDSVFIKLGDKEEKDALKFAEEINAKLPGLMELEYEGTYPRALFVAMKESDYGAKKKYALIDKENSITIKGFETVRRNVSAITKETQEEVIRIILEEGDTEKAVKFVTDVINDLKERRVPVKKLVIPTFISKPIDQYDSIGPHVAVAKKMEAKGIEVYPGMKIEYVIVSGKEKIRDRARLPEEVKQTQYDPSYYLNHQLIPALEKILEVLGENVEEIAEGKKQSKLGQFF